jgi:two-component system sensor histidine kinase HydH
MPALLDRTVKLIARDAAAKQVALASECGLAAEDRPLLDPDRMAQCLLNLYLNAIEAMPSGGALRIAVDRATDDSLVIEVRDTGAGIPTEHLSRIFDPYFTTKSSGTGLGLAIVHKIVEAHAGRIYVFSEAGQGTRFRIVLPDLPDNAAR